MKTKIIFLVLLINLFSLEIFAHHYKGLPHNDYFDNYPQVPILEFIKETKDFEVYMTIYNFQGINLENVDTPNMVRFYIYIYDLELDKVYFKKANFKIYSHGKLLYKTGYIASEEENIYTTHLQIKEQDDLKMLVTVKNKDGKEESISLDFQITKTIWQKYGVGIAIVLFFVLIGIIKKIIHKNKGDENV